MSGQRCWFGDGREAEVEYWFEPQQVWRPLCASHESVAAGNLPEHYIRAIETDAGRSL